jgi:hypothetical protein
MKENDVVYDEESPFIFLLIIKIIIYKLLISFNI